MDLEKKENEGELQYIWRLCFEKDIGNLDLTWRELSDIFNKNLRTEDSYQDESSWRKQYQTAKKFYDEIFSKKNFDEEYLNDLVVKKHELQKEKYKLFDERRALNKIALVNAREEELLEILKNKIERDKLPSLNRTTNNEYTATSKDMLISLNDIHYGANINNYWNIYNSSVCIDRMNKYLDKIIEIQNLNNCENCIVWCNGDCISGNIHKTIAITNKENVIEQVMGVSELIAQFLMNLSNYFKTVKFVSVSGNHSRIDSKDDSLISERLDDIVEWWIKERLQNINNIIFDGYDKIDYTMYMVNIRGLNYIGVHGDFDDNINKILSLQQMNDKPIYAILSGHLHHNKIETVQGIKTIMSGSMQGMDDYCIQKRIFGFPEQIVCVCDAQGIYSSYDIKL